VNIIILLKNRLQEGFKIFFIIITLMNSVLIFSQQASNHNVEENTYPQTFDQAINFSPEVNCTKPKTANRNDITKTASIQRIVSVFFIMWRKVYTRQIKIVKFLIILY